MVDEEFYKLTDAYREKFDDVIPMWELGLTSEKVIEICKECLKSGKPYEFDEETKKFMENSGVDF